MCKAISAIVTKNGDIYWKTGIDSHEELIKEFSNKEPLLKEKEEPPKQKFARVELSPKDNNYLKTRKKDWVLKLDEQTKPEWWDLFLINGEEKCWNVWKKWKKEVYPLINLKEARNPINPIKIKHSNKVSKKEIEWLKEWASVGASVRASVGDSVRASVRASVWASVWDSVWDSVWASMWDSVGASVWASVWDSVWASVWDSVWAYTGYLFPGIKKWKYVENIKGYPYQSAVKLWKVGLVPSFDGKVWRLHKMCDKARIIYEIKKEDLN